MKEKNKNLEKAIKFLLTNFGSLDIGNPNDFLYGLAVANDYYSNNFKKLNVYKSWVSLDNNNSYEHIKQYEDDDGNIIGIFKVNGDVYSASWNINSYDDPNYDNILSTFKKVKPIEKTIIVYEAE